MTYTIPILVNDVQNVTLPFSLYKDKDFEIFFSDFSVVDREILFDIKGLEILEDGRRKFKHVKGISSNGDKFPEFISSSYRFLVQPKEDNEEYQKIFSQLSFSLNLCCLLYFNYPITLTIFGSDVMSSSQHSLQTFINKAKKPIVTEELLNSFKKTLDICINDKTVDKKKKLMFSSLLNISVLQSFNAGLICSTYITIIESLFTNDNSEVNFKFSIRLAKYLKENIDFVVKLKKLYGKRSSYYHTGEIKFDNDDDLFLSSLTRKLIVDYIQNPLLFEISKLDEALLN